MFVPSTFIESHVCSKHLHDGIAKTITSASLGVKFAECPSEHTARGKRRVSHVSQRQHDAKRPCERTRSPKPSPSHLSPLPDPLVASPPRSSRDGSEASSISLIQSEFRASSFLSTPGSLAPIDTYPPTDMQVTVNIALVSQIEVLVENRRLKMQV